MNTSEQPTPIYELQVTAVGPLVEEFTAAGMWVFFREGAPEELVEFALLHQAESPQAVVKPGCVMEIDTRRYIVTAVGDVANENIKNLGHLVLKANGATEPEMPGDVCIEAQPLPEPTVGTQLRIWNRDEGADGTV